MPPAASGQAGRPAPASGGPAFTPVTREPGAKPGEAGITLTRDMVLGPDDGQAPDDASTIPHVTAEWALWGKEANETAYRVLRCSAGTFNADDFREIITRYASGVKEQLPQYTICWIPSVQGHPAYLAVAIHELADPDPRRSGGRSRTAGGREIEYVRLFCVPYDEMAGQRVSVSYTELIESVKGFQLPPGETAPISVPLLSEVGYVNLAASFRQLAENVVALLLAIRPVCVLGAEDADPDKRLQFIELVMSLLPYGLRSRMSASTWASSTAQDLKLRLFFANARRDDGDETSYVTWGDPRRLDLSEPGLDAVRLYVDWLRQVGPRAAPALAGETAPLRFNDADVRRMVASLPRDRSVTETLEELADGIRKDDAAGIRVALDRLRRYLASQDVPAYREQCRQVIIKRHLLRDHPGLHPSTKGAIYRVLLQLGFEKPLTYASYCQIEQAVGGWTRGALRTALLKFRFTSFIPLLLVAKAEPGFRDEALLADLIGQGVDPTGPIDEVDRCAASIQPGHRAMVYEFASGYLIATAEDARRELKRRGFLAETLEELFPGNVKEQLVRLRQVLRICYGEPLTDGQIVDIFDHSSVYPTEAFAQAVRSMTASPRAASQIAQLAAIARLRNAGHEQDALIVARGAEERFRPPIGERMQLIPRSTIYTGIVVFIACAFVVYLLLTAAHV